MEEKYKLGDDEARLNKAIKGNFQYLRFKVIEDGLVADRADLGELLALQTAGPYAKRH